MGSITVAWDNPEQTAVRLDFKWGWTWLVYDCAVNEAADLIEGATQEVDIILNLLRGPQMPVDYVFSHLRRTLRRLPDNTGCLAIVGGDATARALLSVFFRTIIGAGPETIFVSSLEEARTWLARGQLRDQARQAGGK
jgi:hypothetical protein